MQKEVEFPCAAEYVKGGRFDNHSRTLLAGHGGGQWQIVCTGIVRSSGSTIRIRSYQGFVTGRIGIRIRVCLQAYRSIVQHTTALAAAGTPQRLKPNGFRTVGCIAEAMP
jgi:hypothetical protein